MISWGYISAGLRSSPVGSGGGGGVARAHIPERLLVIEPSLKLVMNRSMRLKNQSLDKTVNIDISTKGGRTRGAQRKITMKRKRLRFDWFQNAGQIYSGKEQVRHQRHSAKIWRLILHVQLSSTPTLTFVELLSSEEKLWLTDENVITGSEWAGLHSLTVLSLDDVISQRLSWLKLTLVTDPSCPDNRDKTEMLRVTFVGDFTSCFAFEKEFY